MSTLTSHKLCLKDSFTFSRPRSASPYACNRVYFRWRSPQAAAIANFHLPMRSYEVKNRTNVDDIKALRLITAIKTPYLPDGRFDLEAYDALVNMQINGGAEAVIVGGTTGEGQLMSWDEHIMLIGHTVNCFGSRIKVIGNTGSNSTREAIHATEQGFAVGMHAALHINPYYGKTSNEGMIAHFESVLSMGPAIVYNVPSRTSQDIPPQVMHSLAQSTNFAGVKECVGHDRNLHSIIATDTAFGRNSASALCSRDLDSGFSKLEMDNKHIKLPDLYLQVLHIGGCTGVSEASLCEILSRGRMLKSLCLRNTFLVDHALFRFPGSSLEILDVSNTMISRDALSHMLNKNPGLRCLEAKGCNNLCPNQMKEVESSLPFSPHGKLFRVLGQDCKLEELSVGWGFSFFSLNSTGSGLRFLKAVNLGLGGSLGPEGLTLLCALCPLLESVTILFQVISDTSIMNLLGTLRNLQALSICYCIGDVSPLCLNHSVPNLRKLNLERVTPWMTNDDLTLLVQNFANLVELSLVGCMHLGVDSQQIISSGWPGLVSLHLEDCGAVTAEGTSFLFGCKALEHLLLRHNGPGIKKSFILDAASRLPMLRSISLDWCDAGEGDFDLPHFADKYSLSNVKISRCKLRKCTLDFYHVGAQKRPVHKETLVLVWNSSSLQRTVVKERIA